MHPAKLTTLLTSKVSRERKNQNVYLSLTPFEKLFSHMTTDKKGKVNLRDVCRIMRSLKFR